MGGGKARNEGRNEATVADLLLRRLQAAGIDYFFANAGTDFPSIIESFARAAEDGTPLPRPMLVPHENAAVAMAHGVYMISGRPQAVMVHTTVGTGNTLNALINASRDSVPLLLLAGRTPVTERPGLEGARNRYIHWAQEMFDQAGMLREIVKWDYELRRAEHVEDVVARALEVAMTPPRGPVYLTLPREVLASGAAGSPQIAARSPPTRAHADPAAIEQLAAWLAAAKHPLIITSNAGRTADAAAALARLAERFALPVVSFNPRFLALPSTHPLHQGYQPGPLLDTADVVLAVDCDVPWIPSVEGPPEHCRVAHLGEDPSFSRYPIRSFPSDLSITAAPAAALAALERVLASRIAADDEPTAARQRALAERSAARRARAAATAEKDGAASHITPEWLSRCIGDAVGRDAIIVNEYPLRLDYCERTEPGSYFGSSPAGGLGWGFGAALGAKLAASGRLVVATLGDGAYVFSNPTACHWTAAAYDLPVLVVLFNNSRYAAVRNATLGMYGEGAAARSKGELLADLSPSPAFEMLPEASGGWGMRVEKPAELPSALARAIDVVTREKRQALLNVICRY